MLIPLSAIDPPHENVRRLPASVDDDASLRTSIASLGVLQPVLVVRVGDRYQVVDGERRARLAADVGLLEIAAEIAPRADEGWTAAAAAAANMCRAEMNPVDRWRIMARLQRLGYTLPAASAALGLTDRVGKRLDRLSKLCPEMLAILERGDWPDDRELGVIASASPEKQAAALAGPYVREAHGPTAGCLNWYRVTAALEEVRIPISRAIFDVTAGDVAWTEDLFAEPGSGEEEFTTDVAGFMAAQKAAMKQKITAPPKGVKYALGKMDNWGHIKPPADVEVEHGADPDKPKKGRTVLWGVDEKGGAPGKIVRIVVKPKAAAKGKPAPDAAAIEGAADAAEDRIRRDTETDDDDPDAEEQDDTPLPALEPPAGITKTGLAMIAEAKTAALRARLSQPLSVGDALAGLVLLLTAPNVTVGGIDRAEHPDGLRDLRERLVYPTGHIDTGDLGTLINIAADALRRCLSVARPDAEKSYNRPDAGEVAEWLGHNLVAGDELPRFDTEEFLATISADILRKIAIEHGHKPATKAADLRRQLVGHLPDWRPAAAQFGAPGPKGPRP